MELTCACKNVLLLVLGLFLVCCSGQDRIIFRDDAESHVEYNFFLPGKIPEKLLIQMKDVKNASELIRRFMRTENTSESARGSIYERRAHSPAPVIAQPASCQPEDQVVELERQGNTAVLLWPSCVRVKRCGGCCTSKLLKCSPTETSLYNVTVLQLLYNLQSPDVFESQGTRVFSLEQHDRCSCNCRTRAEHCGPAQEYREDECRCACANQDQAAACTGPRMIWDNSDCACKCRRTEDCSTGSYFNLFKCRCEPF